MTVTGMMCVGLSSPSPSPSTTQVGIYLVLGNLSSILLFPLVERSVTENCLNANRNVITVKIHHLIVLNMIVLWFILVV